VLSGGDTSANTARTVNLETNYDQVTDILTNERNSDRSQWPQAPRYEISSPAQILGLKPHIMCFELFIILQRNRYHFLTYPMTHMQMLNGINMGKVLLSDK
jgi:hypothetical protein